MTITVDAVYENGVLRPTEPLPLKERDRVQITIHDTAGVQPADKAAQRGLIRQLERAAENQQELNGNLIAHLIDLGAVEAAPAMERAYAAGSVDEMCGDWEHAQYELGLTDEPPAEDELPPSTESPFVPLLGFFDDRPPRDHKAKAKAKARRKMAAKSRRRNRKK